MRDQYLVIIEPADDGSYSAYLPDVDRFNNVWEEASAAGSR